MDQDNHYVHAVLDRAAHLRTNADWLRASFSAPDTRVVPVWRSRNLVRGGEMPQATLMRMEEAAHLMEKAATTVLLGIRDEVVHVAIDLSDLDEDGATTLHAEADFVELRSVGAVMDRNEAAILAYARGILFWHSRHRFCGVCGSPTEVRDAGHLRVCTSPDCASPHFPRTDPAVIMLVSSGDRALLGRKAEWMEGMYSTLAGFVEPGESLEQAVAREVMEEAGVPIANIRYHSSQPWPFPSSLMLGFYADALSEDICRNDDELEDLQWFTRAELAEGGAGIASRPRSDSIARRLIDEWIRQGG